MRFRSAAGLVAAGCLLIPTPAAAASALVPHGVAPAVAATPATAAAPQLVPVKKRKPKASLKVTSKRLSSRKVRVSVKSNAKKVRIKYRTASGKKRTRTKAIKRGSATIVLPTGAKSIRVQAAKTGKRAASPWKSTKPRPATVTEKVPAPATSAASAAPAGSTITADELEVVRLVNEARSAARSCGGTQYSSAPPLKVDSRLVRSARGHSEDMASYGYFSHQGRDGSLPWDRMRAAGYSYHAAGENIAAGMSTPQAAVSAWLRSPGHCANIMKETFTEIGVGYAHDSNAQYRHYWTQNFGRP